MRSLIIGFVVFLAACNGDSGSTTIQQVPYSDPVLVAKVESLSVALATTTHIQAQQAMALNNMQFIGKVHGVVSAERLMAIGRAAAVVNFGPCIDMGLFQGRGGSDSGNPLLSQFEIYKTTNCTSSNGVFTSYSDLTGLHDVPPFIAWDQPNCQGNMYIETDIPQNTYPGAILSGGIVFKNPIDGLAYWLKGAQTPQQIQIQSALNTSPNSSGCNPDAERRLSVLAIRNDITQSGIPDSLVPGSWSNVAP